MRNRKMGSSSSSQKSYVDVHGHQHSSYKEMNDVNERYLDGKTFSYIHSSDKVTTELSSSAQTYVDVKKASERAERGLKERQKEQNKQLGYSEKDTTSSSEKPKAVKRSRDEDDKTDDTSKKSRDGTMCYTLGYMAGKDSFTGDASSFRDGSAGASLGGAALCRMTGNSFDWSKGYSDEKSGKEFGASMGKDSSECSKNGVCEK